MGKRAQELEGLYRRRYQYFVRVAASITGDVESGRDAVQTAFATAVRKRRSFRGKLVGTWSFRPPKRAP